MRRLKRSPIWPALLASAALLVVPACVGQAPGNDTPAADGGSNGGADAGPQADGGSNPAALKVSGMVMDYHLAVGLNQNQPLQAQLATAGLNPPVSGDSLTDGSYSLGAIPPGSLFYIHAERDNYRPTRNEQVEVTDASVQSTVYAVSDPDVQRWHNNLVITEQPDTGFVVVDMYRNNGTPLEGVAATDAKIVDGLGATVATAYFFGLAGDPVDPATLAVSTAYNGHSRAGFYNIPAGDYQISITYLDGQGNPMTQLVPITVMSGGVTLARSGGAGGGTPPPGTNLTFTNDVYPLLQRAALGGDACANCHTAGGAAALLPYDGPAADVYAKIMGTVNVVNLDNPELSLLITKPMYEDPPNHPNATYADINDPSLQIILAWIQQGAVQ